MQDNNHITKYLDYYLQREKNPDYAILITGCWGSGKTYFIKEYLGGENFSRVNDWLTDCEKYCVVYVSLFGAKSREDISQRIVDRISPNLKKLSVVPNAISLVAKLSGIAIGTVLAAGSDSSIAFPIGNAIGNAIGDASKYFTSKFIKSIKVEKERFKKIVVVFDDVERTRMTPKELLGYINEFVECQHIPCILIADKDHWEENLSNLDDKKTLQNISTTKEKIVGKIFQIQTSFDSIWNVWSKGKCCPIGDRAWKLLLPCKDIIQRIVCASEKNNFRSLKHTLLDFQRFVDGVDDKYLDNAEFNALLIADFICFQYSSHLGDIKVDDIGVSNSWNRGFARVGNQNLTDKELEDKYPKTVFEKFEKRFESIERLSCISENQYGECWLNMWKLWLGKNYVNPQSINDLIRNSIWFDRHDEYYLGKMYGWFMTDDDTGRKAMDAFENALKKETLLNPISIMCLCYHLFWLAKRNVFKESYENFCIKMQNYVKKVSKKLEYKNVEDWLHHTTIDSTTYIDEKDQLDALKKVLTTELASRKQEYEKSQKNEFFALMKSDDYAKYEKGCRIIANESSELENFSFAKIDVNVFCSVYQNIPAKWTSNCFNAIERRYSNKPDLLKQEEPFLKNLLNCANQIYDNAERPLVPSVFSLYYLKRTIANLINQKKEN